MWALLSSPEAREGEQGQEKNTDLMWRLLRLSWPDLPYLVAAFFFLVVAVLGESGRGHWGPEVGKGPWCQHGHLFSSIPLSGETVIPYYSGRVIDILRGDFNPDAFATAIFFMCLFSIGR